jgi:hypothetical protein
MSKQSQEQNEQDQENWGRESEYAYASDEDWRQLKQPTYHCDWCEDRADAHDCICRPKAPQYNCHSCEDRDDAHGCVCHSKPKKQRLRIAKAYATIRLRDGELDGNYGPFQAAMMAAREECGATYEPFSKEWLTALQQHPTFHQWQSWCWDPSQSTSSW